MLIEHYEQEVATTPDIWLGCIRIPQKIQGPTISVKFLGVMMWGHVEILILR